MTEVFENIAAHFRDNRSLFLGDVDLTAEEAKVVSREAYKVAKAYRAKSDLARTTEKWGESGAGR